MRRRALLLSPLLLGACVSVEVGADGAPHVHLLLHDTAPVSQRRPEPVVAALLIQPLPSDAMADTASIAYSRRANEFAFYQFSTWTERPVRQIVRLLQRRLEASGIAGAVGVIGEPLHADWLLTVAIDTLHHDLTVPPGQGRLALTAELFDRRNRTRISRRRFEAAAPAASADAPAAAAALSQSVAQVFDSLLPWLVAELLTVRAAAAG
jgi:ABC-type uncharacterized transport system auxiliary subunit